MYIVLNNLLLTIFKLFVIRSWYSVSNIYVIQWAVIFEKMYQNYYKQIERCDFYSIKQNSNLFSGKIVAEFAKENEYFGKINF